MKPNFLPLAGFASAIALLLCSTLARAELIQKKSLSLDDAKKVAAAAVAEAKKSAGTAAIAVVDDGGNLMLVERLDGTFAAGANISIGKARTAALFKKSTGFFENIINKGRTAMTALSDFTPLQGGVPIYVDGFVVGAIGVSGAASAQHDEEVANAGANAIAMPAQISVAPTMQGATKSVTFFDHDTVAAAFAKGAILFPGDGTNYAVHASRRVVPGQVEVHTRDADVIYVLEGAATLVTGGKGVDMKMIATDEFRGRDIDGGESRNLAKGDVIIIPAGVPHWFKTVSGEFHYYVVKVS